MRLLSGFLPGSFGFGPEEAGKSRVVRSDSAPKTEGTKNGEGVDDLDCHWLKFAGPY
jgi:hypothetical protein